jgi:hypothetical protein
MAMKSDERLEERIDIGCGLHDGDKMDAPCTCKPFKLVMIHLRGELPESFRSACPSCSHDHNGIIFPGVTLMPDVAVPSAVKYCQMCGRV